MTLHSSDIVMLMTYSYAISYSYTESLAVNRSRIVLRANEHEGFCRQIMQVVCAVLTAGTIEIFTGQMLNTARVNIKFQFRITSCFYCLWVWF